MLAFAFLQRKSILRNRLNEFVDNLRAIVSKFSIEFNLELFLR